MVWPDTELYLIGEKAGAERFRSPAYSDEELCKPIFAGC